MNSAEPMNVGVYRAAEYLIEKDQVERGIFCRALSKNVILFRSKARLTYRSGEIKRIMATQIFEYAL